MLVEYLKLISQQPIGPEDVEILNTSFSYHEGQYVTISVNNNSIRLVICPIIPDPLWIRVNIWCSDEITYDFKTGEMTATPKDMPLVIKLLTQLSNNIIHAYQKRLLIQ